MGQSDGVIRVLLVRLEGAQPDNEEEERRREEYIQSIEGRSILVQTSSFRAERSWWKRPALTAKMIIDRATINYLCRYIELDLPESFVRAHGAAIFAAASAAGIELIVRAAERGSGPRRVECNLDIL